MPPSQASSRIPSDAPQKAEWYKDLLGMVRLIILRWKNITAIGNWLIIITSCRLWFCRVCMGLWRHHLGLQRHQVPRVTKRSSCRTIQASSRWACIRGNDRSRTCHAIRASWWARVRRKMLWQQTCWLWMILLKYRSSGTCRSNTHWNCGWMSCCIIPRTLASTQFLWLWLLHLGSRACWVGFPVRLQLFYSLKAFHKFLFQRQILRFKLIVLNEFDHRFVNIGFLRQCLFLQERVKK